MRELFDSKRLEKLLSDYHFEKIFDTPNLPFHLYTYEKGETLNLRKDFTQNLLFILEGSIAIYAFSENDTTRYLCTNQGFTLLGDIEFTRGNSSERLVEATSDLLCIELPITSLKTTLLSYRAFLYFLLNSVTKKLDLFINSETISQTLEEKILYYMRYCCESYEFHGVEQTANHLHCSRRQLQRILKQLCEKEILIKVKKGCYRLVL
ncbi:hypothetical protein P261_02561 [Lachnospiraceae bacterium TWA4]|nr:hypothetical protein P261_02561 [Lachnospiraceae bacterium TWA4]